MFGLGLCFVLLNESPKAKRARAYRVFHFFRRRTSDNGGLSSFASNHQEYSYNRLTNIDWDIVETAGLDIDLQGQLAPAYDQHSRREYLQQQQQQQSADDNREALIVSEDVLFEQSDRQQSKAKANKANAVGAPTSPSPAPPLVQIDDHQAQPNTTTAKHGHGDEDAQMEIIDIDDNKNGSSLLSF